MASIAFLLPLAARRLDCGAAKTALRILISKNYSSRVSFGCFHSLVSLSILESRRRFHDGVRRRCLRFHGLPAFDPFTFVSIYVIQSMNMHDLLFLLPFVRAVAAIVCLQFGLKFGLSTTFGFSGWDSNSVDWNPFQPHLILMTPLYLAQRMTEFALVAQCSWTRREV